MKYLFYISLAIFYSSGAFAAEVDCEVTNEVVQLARDLSIPNCLSTSKFPESPNRQNQICNDCKREFESKFPAKLPTVTKSDLSKNFATTIFNDYKKTMAENLLQVVKQRSGTNSKSSFSKSINSCRMRTANDFKSGCKNQENLNFLDSTIFEDLNKSMAVELATILSKKPEYKPDSTLLNRDRSKNACFIPESQLLYVANSVYEESIPANFIQLISTLDPRAFTSVNDMILSDQVSEVYPDDVTDIMLSLKNHPILKDKARSPESFINFLKSIKAPYSPKDLKEQLDPQDAADKFDESLARNCDQSFNALKEALCSDKLKAGDINLNAVKNAPKLDSRIKFDDTLLSSSEEILNSNLNFFKLCPISNNRSLLELSSVSDLIGQNLDAKHVASSFATYRSDKYETDLGSTRKILCEESSCPPDNMSLNCKLKRKYKEVTTPGTYDNKMATSANDSYNALLRSMIGDTSKLDPQTKEILISNGIIPQADGTVVAQPDIPERRPEFLERQNNQTRSASTNAAAAPSSSGQSARRSNSQAFNDLYQTPDQQTSPVNMPDLSDIMENSSELRNIQDEIRRRLGDMPNRAPANREAAKRVVQESARAQNQTLSPEQENTIADRLMNTPAPTRTIVNNMPNNASSPNRASASSNNESASDRRANEQRNAALMGMSGAQQGASNDNGRGPASESPKQKDLTKVALNLGSDPRVNISDIFRNKLNSNDPETQLLKVLLKNKSNFLLQVDSLNFRIVFNERNGINVLLDSGNSADAERLRPQLEMFLNRLRN